jgi:hypothetical protein
MLCAVPTKASPPSINDSTTQELPAQPGNEAPHLCPTHRTLEELHITLCSWCANANVLHVAGDRHRPLRKESWKTTELQGYLCVQETAGWGDHREAQPPSEKLPAEGRQSTTPS